MVYLVSSDNADNIFRHNRSNGNSAYFEAALFGA